MNKDILYQKIEIINSSDIKQLEEIKKLKLDEITKQNKELEEMIKKFEQQDINQKDIEEMIKNIRTTRYIIISNKSTFYCKQEYYYWI